MKACQMSLKGVNVARLSYFMLCWRPKYGKKISVPKALLGTILGLQQFLTFRISFQVRHILHEDA